MTVGISAASLVASLALRRARGPWARAALPAAALSVRLLRENHPRHAAHRAKCASSTTSSVRPGASTAGAGGHSHPVAVLEVPASPKSCGSLLSLDAGADGSGPSRLTRTQTLRYVVAPQLLARTLPALTGQVASIIRTRRCCRSLPSSNSPKPCARSPPRTTTSSADFCSALYRCSHASRESRHFEKKAHDYAH